MKELLESTCASLGSYANECRQLVDQYFPLVWDELEALLADSRGLCNALGMCQGSRHHVGSRPLLDLLPSTKHEEVSAAEPQ